MHKFLHLADVHLDSGILCRSDSLRSKLNQELQAGFRKAIDCAIHEKVVAVFIAGDLFDANNLTVSTEFFLHEQFERLNAAHIPVIYTSGQSDPSDAVSEVVDTSWPKNVIHIRERSPKVIELQDVDGKPIARVVGAGFATKKEPDNLTLHFPDAKDSIPYIGIVHTWVRSALGAQDRKGFDVSPSDVKNLKSKGYLYWALGGVHHRQRLAGASQAWYPGNFMGRRPEESGQRGGLLVTLTEENLLNVEPRFFSSVQWFDITLSNLEQASDVEDLFRYAEQEFDTQKNHDEAFAVQLVRLTLKGMCPIAEELQSETRRAVLEEKLAQHLNVDDVEIRVEHFTPLVDIQSYRNEPHLLSEVLGILDAVTTDPGLIEELAPEHLAHKVDGEQREHYLASLLTGFDREAIVRLTREEPHAH